MIAPKRFLGFCVFLLSLNALPIFAASKPFTEEFPEVKKYLFQEPHSPFYLGFGVSPIAIMASKIFFSADMFEINVITEHWDINALTASLGFAIARDDFANSRHFTFRIAPKYRIAPYLSVGPMVGAEFVSFPNLQARINKAGYFSNFEPFSSHGLIFGAEASELFHFGEEYLFKITELIYKQTYSVTTTSDGWSFNYALDSVSLDPTPIKPSWVFLMQFSMLF